MFYLCKRAIILEGGKTYTVEAPIDTIPVFIREGKLPEVKF